MVDRPHTAGHGLTLPLLSFVKFVFSQTTPHRVSENILDKHSVPCHILSVIQHHLRKCSSSTANLIAAAALNY